MAAPRRSGIILSTSGSGIHGCPKDIMNYPLYNIRFRYSWLPQGDPKLSALNPVQVFMTSSIIIIHGLIHPFCLVSCTWFVASSVFFLLCWSSPSSGTFSHLCGSLACQVWVLWSKVRFDAPRVWCVKVGSDASMLGVAQVIAEFMDPVILVTS
jgi:hypothetical protein